MYFEDWEDYHQMEVPFLFERLVVADRSSASRTVQRHQPVFSPAFDIATSPYWWEPIRKTLSAYFDICDNNCDVANNQVVTYIHRQGFSKGPKMARKDHFELVRALDDLKKRRGYQVHVVSPLDEAPWSSRLKAVVGSTVSSRRLFLAEYDRIQVVLGVHSDELFDAVYSKSCSRATLMEFFPSHSFVRDRQMVAQSLQLNYIAWWPDR